MATGADTTEGTAPARRRRLETPRRQGEQVSPLELFFDLVFVLAITQCTQLMSDNATWGGLGQGILVLAILWWAWVGYAWLTSVVDPDEDAVRIVIFVATAALLIVALCVPQAFGQLGPAFAIAYPFVRAAHIGLFLLASADDPGLKRSVTRLGLSTAIGCGVLIAGSFVDDETARAAIWALALVLDTGGTWFIRAEGWRLVPAHFAERHGLIVIIALGESIVAIGVGRTASVNGEIVATSALGIAVAAALWWVYFDVTAIAAERRLARAHPGREQNEIARDSF